MKNDQKTRSENRELIKSTLQNTAFIQINKKIARLVGIKAAVLLGELVSRHTYFETREWLKEDGFFAVSDHLKAETTLSYKEQKTAIKELTKFNLIEVERVGLPSKLYFYIQWDNIATLLSLADKEFKTLQEFSSRPTVVEGLDQKKQSSNKSISIKVKNKNISNKEPVDLKRDKTIESNSGSKDHKDIDTSIDCDHKKGNNLSKDNSASDQCQNDTTVADRNIAKNPTNYIPRDIKEEIDKYSKSTIYKKGIS